MGLGGHCGILLDSFHRFRGSRRRHRCLPSTMALESGRCDHTSTSSSDVDYGTSPWARLFIPECLGIAGHVELDSAGSSLSNSQHLAFVQEGSDFA